VPRGLCQGLAPRHRGPLLALALPKHRSSTGALDDLVKEQFVDGVGGDCYIVQLMSDNICH
jgi:hypothetical protein